MSKKILVVKHPSGIKRAMEFNKSDSLAIVFSTASKELHLKQHAHELKLGPKTMNLNETIEGSKIPETVELDIAPKTASGNDETPLEVLVQMGFSDEGYLYEHCSKVMSCNQNLWDVVTCMVPSHMAYSDEDVCLTYMGVNYSGKKRLKTVKLVDLCARERQLFFTCARNYLQKPYKRSSLHEKRNKVGQLIFQRTQPKTRNLEEGISTKPTFGTPNPGVVELNERLGRIYHGKYIGTQISELGGERSSDSMRRDFGEGQLLVRIVFPKSAIMEGLFSEHETIKDVANFVRSYLTDKAKHFYFYTVQPRLIVGPNVKLGLIRSSPPGTLWYCGNFKTELFREDVRSSLVGKVFSYFSSDVPEESKVDLTATPSSYSWEINASKRQ